MIEVNIFISNGVVESVKKDNHVRVTIYEHDELRTEDDLKDFREDDRVVTLHGDDYVITEY